MIQVACPSCQASYDLDERRIPASGMRMRCPKCNASFQVGTDGSAKLAPAAPPPKPPGPPAPPPPPGGRPKLAPPVPVSAAAHTELDLPATKVAPVPQPPAARSFDLGDLDLPAPKSTAVLGELDLPAPKSRAMDELDLPAPKASAPKAGAALLDVDLPAAKPPKHAVGGDFELDLPVARPVAGFDDLDLPAPKGLELDLPMPKAPARPTAPSLDELDLPSPKVGGAFDLDLPVPAAKAQVVDLPRPAVPSVPPDLPRPSLAHADLPLPTPGGAGGLELDLSAISSKKAATPFGDLDLGTPPPRPAASGWQTSPVDAGMEAGGEADLGAALDGLSLPPPRARPLDATPDGRAGAGSTGFGEVDLGDGGADELEFGGLGGGAAIPDLGDVAPIVRESQAPEPLSVEERKALALAARKKRFVRVLVGTSLVLFLGGAGGFALKFTKYGPFGRYALEQFLPAAGSPASAQTVIQAAEQRAKSDTYGDVRGALSMLSSARRNEGLNRTLLARSLMHESLYLVRFGDDPSATSRASGLLARLAERSNEAPGIELALAAHALRLGDPGSAQSHLVRARAVAPNDPYVGLVAGEIALADGKPADAITAFRAALAHNGGARAQWGLARALVAAHDEGADAAIEATLTQSPAHIEARTEKAKRLLAAGHPDEALAEARKAAGFEAGPHAPGSSRSRALALVVVGRIEELANHRADARYAYNAAADLDGYNLDALVGAGRVLLEENLAREALVRFDSAIQTDSAAVSMFATEEQPRTLVAAARLGAIRALIALERSNDAQAHVQALLAQYPNDPEVLLAAGRVAHAAHRDPEAEAAFRKVIEVAPSLFAGYLELSQLLFDLGRPDDAATALAGAEGKVEVTAEVRRLEGEVELRRNNLPLAREKFLAALALDPQDRTSMFELGVAFRRDGALVEAANWFDRLAAIDDSYPGLALERGDIYVAQGQADSAVRMFERALRERPDDVEVQVRLGGAQVAAGHLDEAEATLRSVLERQSTMPAAIHYMGRLLLARGQIDDAIVRLSDAVRLDGTRPEFHAWLAAAHLEKSNLAQAQLEIEATLERDPQSVDGHLLRARLFARSGRLDEALAESQIVLGLDARRTEIWAVVAECEEQRGRRPEAIRDYRAALAGDPNRGDWWAKLARLQVDSGDQRGAIASYERAIEIGIDRTPRPGYVVESLRGLGETAAEIGDRDKARQALGRYLEFAPRGASGRGEVEELLRRL